MIAGPRTRRAADPWSLAGKNARTDTRVNSVMYTVWSYGTFLNKNMSNSDHIFEALKSRLKKAQFVEKTYGIYLKLRIFWTILITLKLCILTETRSAATLKNVVQVDGVNPLGRCWALLRYANSNIRQETRMRRRTTCMTGRLYIKARWCALGESSRTASKQDTILNRLVSSY